MDAIIEEELVKDGESESRSLLLLWQLRFAPESIGTFPPAAHCGLGIKILASSQ